MFARFTVAATDQGVTTGEGIEVAGAEGPLPLGDWQILSGTVTISAPAAMGALGISFANLAEEAGHA